MIILQNFNLHKIIQFFFLQNLIPRLEKFQTEYQHSCCRQSTVINWLSSIGCTSLSGFFIKNHNSSIKSTNFSKIHILHSSNSIGQENIHTASNDYDSIKRDDDFYKFHSNEMTSLEQDNFKTLRFTSEYHNQQHIFFSSQTAGFGNFPQNLPGKYGNLV
jgi:hypothetical protein